MKFIVKARTISESNRSRNEHWTTTRERVKDQHAAVSSAVIDASVRGKGFALKTYVRKDRSVGVRLVSPPLPCVVTLTRIAPRALDGHDNVRAALKAVVDEIAALLGVDDRDPRVTWQYDQRRGEPKQFAVDVEIAEAGPL